MNKAVLKKIIANQIKVTSYLTYEEFLEDFYQEAKKNIKPYSWLEFADDLGFSKTNVLRLISTKERILTSKAALKISTAIGLTGSDKRYFENMVKFQNSKSPKDRDEYFQKMLFEKTKDPYKEIDENQTKYLSEWYFPVIREVFSSQAGTISPEEIRDRLNFPLRLDTIKTALAQLVAMGYLVETETGRLIINDKTIKTPKHVDSLAVTRFHQQMIEMGKESITRVDESERSIQGLTVRLTKSDLSIIDAKLSLLIQEIMNMEQSSGGEIYQFNIQLFPFFKRSEK